VVKLEESRGTRSRDEMPALFMRATTTGNISVAKAEIMHVHLGSDNHNLSLQNKSV